MVRIGKEILDNDGSINRSIYRSGSQMTEKDLRKSSLAGASYKQDTSLRGRDKVGIKVSLTWSM